MSAKIDYAIIAECEAVISKYGIACETSAQFCSGDHRLSLHTCFGPAQAGKTVNEDAVLGVQCNDSTPIKWACALADGVGSSLLSEVGSRVATWVAIASLLECSKRTAPRKRADVAIAQALSAIPQAGRTTKTGCIGPETQALVSSCTRVPSHHQPANLFPDHAVFGVV